MKTPQQALEELERRLERTWSTVLAGTSTWNGRVGLSPPRGEDLTGDLTTAFAWERVWRAWAQEHSYVGVETVPRRVGPTRQQLPAALVVPDLDTAGRLLAGAWPMLLHVATERLPVLTLEFAHLDADATGRVLRACAGLSELDFELACGAGRWFAENDATGLTPRQVPIPGMHAKWLNTRQALVLTLSGRESLGLADPHPPWVQFTYLDPEHRALGGRLHDSHTLGDAVVPAYPVRTVLISENKDTAVAFPALSGGVAVQGGGSNVALIAHLEWVRRADAVIYWGDIDVDGLQILNSLRAAGVPARSLLMSSAAWKQWQRFGTAYDRNGQLLRPQEPRAVPYLDADEAALYRELCSPTHLGHRRVEQERIPLAVAHRTLTQLLGDSSPPHAA